MTAFENNTRYVGDVRECSNYAARTLKKTINDKADILVNRAPASKNETAFAEILKKEAEAFSDQVDLKSYTAKLNRKRYSNIFTGFLLLIITALVFLSHYLMPILSIPTLVIWLIMILFFLGIFSISKKKSAKNLIVTKKAEEIVEQNIILTANIDAPTKKVFNGAFNALLKFICFILVLFAAVYPVLSLIEKYNLISLTFNPKLFVFVSGICAFLASLISFIYGSGFNTNISTPGVSNNMTGCYALLGVLRYLNVQNLNFKNTQICVLFSGSKYPANAGTRQFIKENIDFYGPGKTQVICVDTLMGKSNLGVRGNLSSTLKKCAKASHIDLKSVNASYLHTQAKPFDSANYKYGVLTTATNSKPDFYETLADTEKNIDVNSIEHAIKTILEFIYSTQEPIKAPEVHSKEKTEITIQTPDGEETQIVEKTTYKE